MRENHVANGTAVPEWVTETPDPVEYQLGLIEFESEGGPLQLMKLSREEYIALKRYLTEIRGLAAVPGNEQRPEWRLPKRLNDKVVLKICRSRAIFEALHYTCFRFGSEHHAPQYNSADLSSMDAQGDTIRCIATDAVLESPANVTVVVRPDCLPAEAARLLRKVAAAIDRDGLVEGCPTEQPKHPFLARHPEIEAA